VPSNLRPISPSVQQVPTPEQLEAGSPAELASIGEQSSLPGPRPSALAAALANSPGIRELSNAATQARSPSTNSPGLGGHERVTKSNYGSFDTRGMTASPAALEDPEVVKRHLVQPDQGSTRYGSPLRLNTSEAGPGIDEDEFSSLRLQGGDVTRGVYKWAEENEQNLRGRNQRSKSFTVARPQPADEVLDIHNIRVPGGFRRNYLRRAGVSPDPTSHTQFDGASSQQPHITNRSKAAPRLFTNNFLEFLTLYGHFAGESLEEDDEVLEPDEYFSSDAWEEYGDQGYDREPGEGSALLTPGTPGMRKRRHKDRATKPTNGSMGALLLLLKSFVGTGVLFLPRAFLNGGMVFSSMVLLGVAALSFHCFILLVNTRLKIEGSFGDMGGILYGRTMRFMILSSIVLSQIGFVAAYIVFTSENLQAFVLAVSNCKSNIDIKFMVLMQLIIFLPLSLIRDISKLGFTALVADAFIMLGLIYLYYYDIGTIVENKGMADITLFNPSSWTLFIGTAIFTFEGVGLIIPIQESMKKPQNFPKVLGLVMVIITVLFTSIGALSYAAYGSSTRTVILLNLPQDNKMVNAVQFMYSLAILLSTPLQLFPAIRILENELFSRSGKYNPYIKWQKNVFRFFLVVICAMIAWGGAGDLDKFVALVGSFACVPLVYVYPPLLHLKAVAKSRFQKGADYALCCFGIVGCIYSTILTVQQWVGGSAAKAPGFCDT
jgi:proton-coupled amino acid transporter